MKDNFNLSEKSQRIILELSRFSEEVVKTSLSKLIPNSYALNNHLKELEELGLITIRKEKVVRITFYISLTDKGRQVAEQLMNADLAAKGTLKKSFFSRSQLILMFLGRVRKATVLQIKDEIPGSYDDLKELEEMNLITQKIDETNGKKENYTTLTGKGEKAIEEINKLKEVIEGR